MAQLFRPRATTIARFLGPALLVGMIGAIALIAEYHKPAYQTDAETAPEQPVPFSHDHHVGGFGLDCQYCHGSAEKSSFAGIPPTHTCMTCHSQVWTNAEMLAPVRESYENDEPLEWTRVYDLPEFVQFDHQSHVTSGVGCETCHGRVDRMPLTRQVRPLTMEWCLDCHSDPAAQLRPRDEVYTMGWDEQHPGRRPDLIDEYGIETERLTNCSICHY